MSLAFTLGPAIDYLYGIAQTSVANVTVDGQPMVAYDGPSPYLEPGVFVVGLDAPPNEPSQAVQGTDLAPIMGGASLQEQYDVPCFIEARQSGATAKQVRDLVGGVFDTFLNLLMADRSLGHLLNGGGALIVKVAATPFLIGTAAEVGQAYRLSFSVRCTDLQIG